MVNWEMTQWACRAGELVLRECWREGEVERVGAEEGVGMEAGAVEGEGGELKGGV